MAQFSVDQRWPVGWIARQISTVAVRAMQLVIGDKGIDDTAGAEPQVCTASDKREKPENNECLLQCRPLLWSLYCLHLA